MDFMDGTLLSYNSLCKEIPNASNMTVYSDRLWQWDPEKYEFARQKVFKDKGQVFWGETKKKCSEFLSLYFGREIKVINMYDHENVSNGMPLTRFDCIDVEKANKEDE